MVALTPLMTNKPVLKNPVDKNRSPPNHLINQTFLILIIVLAFWFIACSFFMYRKILIHLTLLLIQFQTLPSERAMTLNNSEISLSSINFHENVIGFSTWIILSVPIIFFILLKSLNILSKFWTVIGLFFLAPFFILLPVYRISKIIYEIHYSTQDEFELWLNLVFIALYLLVFHGTVTNFCRLAKIIKKTSRVISFFPALFLLGFITVILSMTVIAFATEGYKCFGDTIYGYSSIFGGIYVFLVIFHFATALISHCAFTWCCTENKKELTGFIILKSICLTFRNHGGLILFNCTVILPAFRWMFSSRIRKFNPDFPYTGLKANTVREWLISNGLEYAFPVVASHEALKEKIYNTIFIRSWFVCLSFGAVFGNLLAFFSTITKIIVLCGANVILVWSNLYHTDVLNETALYLAWVIYFFGFMFVSLVLGASVLVFSIAEDIKEFEEQEVFVIKQGEGIEVCIINQTPETDETLIV